MQRRCFYMGNDDVIYRTENWDILLEQELEKYPDDIYCAWMNDKFNYAGHCAFPIVSRVWYETLGYFTPGTFHFHFNDTWIFDIAKRIDRCHFISHIVGEHMHYCLGCHKSAMDDTYARNQNSEIGNVLHADRDIFDQKENQDKRQADADKLMKLIESFERVKEKKSGKPETTIHPVRSLPQSLEASDSESSIKRFSILTPSRNRPVRLKTFIDSVFELCEFKHRVEIMVYIDSDDPSIDEYRQLEADIPYAVKFIYGEPMSVSKSWNILAEQCSGDVLIMGNDDLIYRTANWDSLLEKELINYPDDIYCAWMEDELNRKKHCAFPIVSRLWYETLGYFTPGVFHFGYNDTWIYDIAKQIDRCHFIPHIVGEHMYAEANKSPTDDTYIRNKKLYKKDSVIFKQKENQDKRQADADKLLNIINSTKPEIVAVMGMRHARYPDSLKAIESLKEQVDILYLYLTNFPEVPHALQQGWIKILHQSRTPDEVARLELLKNEQI